jgi:hypothetical protein
MFIKNIYTVTIKVLKTIYFVIEQNKYKIIRSILVLKQQLKFINKKYILRKQKYQMVVMNQKIKMIV